MDATAGNAPKSAVRVAVLTLSDTRTAADDAAGKLLRDLLGEAGFRVVHHAILREDGTSLREAVTSLVAGGDVDAVVTTGGTGIAPRDRTIETLVPMFERTLDGFGETFRRLSWDEIGPRAILSRATAGVLGEVFVVALPGSTNAVRLGVATLVVPILGHAVDLLHGRTHHDGPHRKDVAR
ncbi:MAG: MogA/MoaB family molybdenum cofactor biosynthesis protein [Polyangiaceae bacterium]